MQIPDSLTPISLSAGVITNLAYDILKHRVQKLEGTLVERMLKWTGIIEPNFNDRLQETLSKALELYFREHNSYALSGVEAFFRDPAVSRQIGSYILDRQPINQHEFQLALKRHLGNDAVTKLLLKRRKLSPESIIPDFLECYHKVLKSQLSSPEIGILLDVLELANNTIEVIRASEERLKNHINTVIEANFSIEKIKSIQQKQEITVGKFDLPIDYTARISNFFFQYLGTPHQPVPFGGREDDINQLNTWLDKQDLYPYLLLLAPAGRGKSALLVRWRQQLMLKNNLTVIFIPVSIRFRTNLASVIFTTLAARLAAFHNEQIAIMPNASIETWRNLIINYLNRPLPSEKGLLLILDGVDEAADWKVGPDLFPLNPPKGLKIVLSARNLVGDPDVQSWNAD